MHFKARKFILGGASLCALSVALAMAACDDPDAVIQEEDLAVEAEEADPEGRAQKDAPGPQQDERAGVIDLSASPPAASAASSGRWDKDDDHGGRWDKDDDHGGRWDKDDDHGGRWDKDDDHW